MLKTFLIQKNQINIFLRYLKHYVKRSSIISFENLTLTFDLNLIFIDKGRRFHPSWPDVSMMKGSTVVSVFIDP